MKTNADCPFNPYTKIFGDASFHNEDYGLFYNNLKANVATRVAAYLSRK